MGGQAVLEGVMMRGASTWAVAVRDPDGSIKLDVRDVPGWAERYRNIPVVRGVMGLGESFGLGYRALTWSANQQVPPEDQVSEKVLGWAVAGAALAFSALFILLPALAGRSLSHRFHGSFPIVEGVARLAIFVVYLLAIGRIRDIRRVFQYHGAEHKAIAAYEQHVEDVASVPKEHDRCGSNLIVPMMLLSAGGTVLLERLVEEPNAVARAGVGLGGASIAVEMFAWSDRHHGDPLAEAFHTPGREIQRHLATKEPTPEQLEVGLAAMAEILRVEHGNGGDDLPPAA